MKLDAALGRRVAFLLLAAFLAFMIWRLAEKRGSEVTLTYDLARIGRTDLARLDVTLRRDGTLVRQTTFFYPRIEASAPTAQRHLVRLAQGDYLAHFLLTFAKGPAMRLQVPFSVPPSGPLKLLPPRRP